MVRGQLVRFGLVGVLNTGFSYAIYAALLALGLPYAAANLGALLIGIVFSFRTQGRLVFLNDDKQRFLRFVAVWAAIYVVNVTLIGLFVSFGVGAYAAGAVALGPIVLLSFVAQKYFVFTLERDDASSSAVDG